MYQPAHVITSWSGVLDALSSGDTLRLVWRGTLCQSDDEAFPVAAAAVADSSNTVTVQGLPVSTTEAIYDSRFGPAELSTVSSQVVNSTGSGSSSSGGGSWMLEQTVARVLPDSSSVSLTVTALDPASLKPVRPNFVIKCPWPSSGSGDKAAAAVLVATPTGQL